MNIFHLFNFFRRNTAIVTLAEARQRAKECYKIGDEDGARRWNSAIEEIIHTRGTGERACPDDKIIFREASGTFW